MLGFKIVRSLRDFVSFMLFFSDIAKGLHRISGDLWLWHIYVYLFSCMFYVSNFRSLKRGVYISVEETAPPRKKICGVPGPSNDSRSSDRDLPQILLLPPEVVESIFIKIGSYAEVAKLRLVRVRWYIVERINIIQLARLPHARESIFFKVSEMFCSGKPLLQVSPSLSNKKKHDPSFVYKTGLINGILR